MTAKEEAPKAVDTASKDDSPNFESQQKFAKEVFSENV
jgi:hypothetical protein